MDELEEQEPEEEELNLISQHLLFNQLFYDLEEIDSKYVENFWEELDSSILLIYNENKRK